MSGTAPQPAEPALHGDRWVLELGDAVVTECSVGHEVALQVHGPAGYVTITFGSAFAIHTDGAEVLLDPETDRPRDLAPVLDLLHAPVNRVEALVDGRLVVRLGCDRSVRAHPHARYEAWGVTGPDGLRLVCMPGGEVAVWSPDPHDRPPGGGRGRTSG